MCVESHKRCKLSYFVVCSGVLLIYATFYCNVLFLLHVRMVWLCFPGARQLLRTRSNSDKKATGDTDLKVVKNSKEKLYVAFL